MNSVQKMNIQNYKAKETLSTNPKIKLIDHVLKKFDDDEQHPNYCGTLNRLKIEFASNKGHDSFTQKNTNIPKNDTDCNGNTELKRSKSFN